MKDFTKTFKEKVLEVVSSIEKGSVMSYGEVAKRAGGVGRSARVVGSIMSKNTDRNIPCHRVVRADGVVGGYNGIKGGLVGAESKINLLKKEGVKFNTKNKIIF